METRFFLAQVEPPDHLERTVYAHVVWKPRREPESVDVRLDVREHENAFVKRVSIHYASNPNEEQHAFEIRGLEENPVCCTLAARAQGVPESRDAALYLPEVSKKMPLLPICRYLGLEAAIAGARSSAVMTGGGDSQSQRRYMEVFAEDDPLVIFLLEQRHHFKKIADADVVLMGDAHKTIGGRRCYAIKKSAADQVARFVGERVVPALVYLGAGNCISIASQQVPAEGEVALVVAIEYVLVTPRASALKTSTYKMNPNQVSLYQVSGAVARDAFAHQLHVARLGLIPGLRRQDQRLGLWRCIAMRRRYRHWSERGSGSGSGSGRRDEPQDVLLRDAQRLFHLRGARVVEPAHEVLVLVNGAEAHGKEVVHGDAQLGQRGCVPVLVAQALERPAVGRKREAKAVAQIHVLQLSVLADLGPRQLVAVDAKVRRVGA